MTNSYKGYGNWKTRDAWLLDEEAMEKAFGPAEFCDECGEEIDQENNNEHCNNCENQNTENNE
jgi:predicted amidophosphoribosyltransferase